VKPKKCQKKDTSLHPKQNGANTHKNIRKHLQGWCQGKVTKEAAIREFALHRLWTNAGNHWKGKSGGLCV
jgi:hypothetical protein